MGTHWLALCRYASLEYSSIGYRESRLVKLDIALNGEVAPPLATIVHKDSEQKVARSLVLKLKEVIPRQQYKLPI